jgi:alpha-ketoglutarate-dependent taurine dioxygenase
VSQASGSPARKPQAAYHARLMVTLSATEDSMPTKHFGPRPHVRSERERLAALHFDRIGVLPLGTTCGAEVSGVELGDVDDATFAELQRAFVEYKVLFFRDQDITTDQHLAFARRFGELEEHPFAPAKQGYDMILELAKDERVKGVENVWHSDVTWRQIPSLGSVLRAVEVPGNGATRSSPTWRPPTRASTTS